MVYFFTVTAPVVAASAAASADDGSSTNTESYTVYMGKNQSENELLIKYGHPEDVWFHVDNLSSAHVYIRMKSSNTNNNNGSITSMTIDDLHDELILDCATLVKANSIAGCKKSETDIVYTRWKNLKKTTGMVDGQVGFHRPENVHKIKAYKDNARIKKIEKTKTEIETNVQDYLYKSQQDRIKEIQHQRKENQRKQDKIEKQKKLEDAKQKELLSYDRLFNNTTSTEEGTQNNINATGDSTAAEEYEDDFF